MAGANGVHGLNVHILALKTIQVRNQFVNDIDDVIRLFLDWVVNHASGMKSNIKFVAFHFVQLMVDVQNGILGVLVLQHVEVELKFVQEIVTIHLLVMVVPIAKEIIVTVLFALCNLVPVRYLCSNAVDS